MPLWGVSGVYVRLLLLLFFFPSAACRQQISVFHQRQPKQFRHVLLTDSFVNVSIFHMFLRRDTDRRAPQRVIYRVCLLRTPIKDLFQ